VHYDFYLLAILWKTESIPVGERYKASHHSRIAATPPLWSGTQSRKSQRGDQKNRHPRNQPARTNGILSKARHREYVPSPLLQPHPFLLDQRSATAFLVW